MKKKGKKKRGRMGKGEVFIPASWPADHMMSHELQTTPL
jgi:hypothetical protein